MATSSRLLRLPLLLCLGGVAGLFAAEPDTTGRAGIADFGRLVTGDPASLEEPLERIADQWHPADAAMLLEIHRFTQDHPVGARLREFLVEQTGRGRNWDSDRWWQWIWSQPYAPHPDYAAFKASLYTLVDPPFRAYFEGNPPATIRLDEIRWGGVRQDGIPPLDHPSVVPAQAATYLADDDVVFGLVGEGQARAYPKRILAWHEMVRDELGGLAVTGAYCTLCGAMIAYRSEVDGRRFVLGTSGFLYRSNKLMYDRGTHSLWNTLTGEPVVGSLVGTGLRLETLPVVTTTWGEWRRRHPGTTVLSLETGYDRDYGEGVAYEEYFSHQRLMFEVPRELKDRRLRPKEEVLALRPGPSGEPALALAVRFLRRHPLHHEPAGGRDLVILTDRSGASRVYAAEGSEFTSWDRVDRLVDAEEAEWRVTEAALLGPAGQQRARVPAHRAFWFGWRAMYPETALVP